MSADARRLVVLFDSIKRVDDNVFPSAPQHLRLRNNPSSTAAPASASDVQAENGLRDDDALPLLPIGGPGAGQSVD